MVAIHAPIDHHVFSDDLCTLAVLKRTASCTREAWKKTVSALRSKHLVEINPHTRMQVLGIVQEIVTSKKMEVTVTNGWWERFRQRHPYLALCTSVPFSYIRAKAQDPESISKYFDLLEDTLKNNDLFDKPTHLFNCDETGVSLNPKPLKTVSEVGAKNPSYLTGSTKRQITVLACTSAAGYALHLAV